VTRAADLLAEAQESGSCLLTQTLLIGGWRRGIADRVRASVRGSGRCVESDLANVEGLYCQLTGQQLTLRYDRVRLWFEFLRAGFAPHQLQVSCAICKRKSVPVAVTSAHSNSPTFSNSTAQAISLSCINGSRSLWAFY
jgi:hypothetical protein